MKKNEKEILNTLFSSGTASAFNWIIPREEDKIEEKEFIDIDFKKYGDAKTKIRRVKYVIQED